jgi:hypothetical protein
LAGAVSDGTGSIDLVFNPNSTLETFSAFGGGTFLFTINDAIAVANGPPIALTGEISSIMTFSPEPASVWICAIGILVLMTRKKFSKP